jgi:hypothetical protein
LTNPGTYPPAAFTTATVSRSMAWPDAGSTAMKNQLLLGVHLDPVRSAVAAPAFS